MKFKDSIENDECEKDVEATKPASFRIEDDFRRLFRVPSLTDFIKPNQYCNQYCYCGRSRFYNEDKNPKMSVNSNDGMCTTTTRNLANNVLEFDHNPLYLTKKSLMLNQFVEMGGPRMKVTRREETARNQFRSPAIIPPTTSRFFVRQHISGISFQRDFNVHSTLNILTDRKLLGFVRSVALYWFFCLNTVLARNDILRKKTDYSSNALSSLNFNDFKLRISPIARSDFESILNEYPWSVILNALEEDARAEKCSIVQFVNHSNRNILFVVKIPVFDQFLRTLPDAREKLVFHDVVESQNINLEWSIHASEHEIVIRIRPDSGGFFENTFLRRLVKAVEKCQTHIPGIEFYIENDEHPCLQRLNGIFLHDWSDFDNIIPDPFPKSCNCPGSKQQHHQPLCNYQLYHTYTPMLVLSENREISSAENILEHDNQSHGEEELRLAESDEENREILSVENVLDHDCEPENQEGSLTELDEESDLTETYEAEYSSENSFVNSSPTESLEYQTLTDSSQNSDQNSDDSCSSPLGSIRDKIISMYDHSSSREEVSDVTSLIDSRYISSLCSDRDSSDTMNSAEVEQDSPNKFQMGIRDSSATLNSAKVERDSPNKFQMEVNTFLLEMPSRNCNDKPLISATNSSGNDGEIIIPAEKISSFIPTGILEDDMPLYNMWNAGFNVLQDFQKRNIPVGQGNLSLFSHGDELPRSMEDSKPFDMWESPQFGQFLPELTKMATHREHIEPQHVYHDAWNSGMNTYSEDTINVAFSNSGAFKCYKKINPGTVPICEEDSHTVEVDPGTVCVRKEDSPALDSEEHDSKDDEEEEELKHIVYGIFKHDATDAEYAAIGINKNQHFKPIYPAPSKVTLDPSPEFETIDMNTFSIKGRENRKYRNFRMENDLKSPTFLPKFNLFNASRDAGCQVSGAEIDTEMAAIAMNRNRVPEFFNFDGAEYSLFPRTGFRSYLSAVLNTSVSQNSALENLIAGNSSSNSLFSRNGYYPPNYVADGLGYPLNNSFFSSSNFRNDPITELAGCSYQKV